MISLSTILLVKTVRPFFYKKIIEYLVFFFSYNFLLFKKKDDLWRELAQSERAARENNGNVFNAQRASEAGRKVWPFASIIFGVFLKVYVFSYIFTLFFFFFCPRKASGVGGKTEVLGSHSFFLKFQSFFFDFFSLLHT